MRFLLSLLVCCSASFAQSVHIKRDGDGLKIRADGYDAVIASDGCLTNLRIARQEYLAPGAGISRGSYFFLNGPLKLDAVDQPDDHTIVASSSSAEVRYEFKQDSMTWTVKNKTDKMVPFYLVMNPLVSYAMDDGGKMIRLPATAEMKLATFITGKTALQISGATKQWGPWERDHQVWEASLAPNEQRTIEFKIVPFSQEHQAKIEELMKPPPEKDITVLSPLDYHVFQRQTKLVGQVRFGGRVKPSCDRVDVRLSGSDLPTDWIDAKLDPLTHSFFVEAPYRAGGWYRAEIRASLDGKDVASTTIEHVGVGEVFVGAGQSNSTNSGGDGRLTTETKMVSTFSGSEWRIADDPQPGVHDNSMGGSFWPAFGDAMYEKYKVPIGLAVTGHGGTSINQWQKGGELFQWTLGRITQLGPGGFRALLWHQGESDTAMTSAEYQNGLTRIIRDMKASAGWDFPWIVAQVSYHNANEKSFDSTRAAQKALWDAGVALEGPDTDTLAGDNRDFDGKGIHFSLKGLRAHGKMWAEKVSAYLDRVLAADERR